MKEPVNPLLIEYQNRSNRPVIVKTGNRLNPHGDLTDKPVKKLPNVKGKIDHQNCNFKPEDVDEMESLFPQDQLEIEKAKEDQKDVSFIGIKQNREPETVVPDRLPTAGLPFYPIDEHFKIGEFESKRNLYLNLAYAYNKAMERIEALEFEIGKLKNK